MPFRVRGNEDIGRTPPGGGVNKGGILKIVNKKLFLSSSINRRGVRIH